MVKQRNEIDEKYQWDLSTIFATDQAWEEEQVNEFCQLADGYILQ